MSINELVYPKCPKCTRSLKPSSHDLLVCRYCKISVKSSVLRKQKDTIQFLKQFTKIPENTEIKEEEMEKIRLREAGMENIKKYKYEAIPDKCIDCNSEDIVADCGNNSWICLSCDSYFELRQYRVMFHGDIEVCARDGDEAKEKGYALLKKGYIDIEADYMGV
ncbi:hypothetical protein LCGC14_1640000 [marine sediment metagenome]|uniref:Uncharacterized protein n=1 Tax=marine sediment metagenome TaxID=412755 RepID=A0A0F9KZJ3_9ZZZZ